MSLDDMQFSNDEDRRRYLADLARLKRIREEEQLSKYKNDKVSEKNSGEIDIPLFMKNNRAKTQQPENKNFYDTYYEEDEYYDSFEDPEYEAAYEEEISIKHNRQYKNAKAAKNINKKSKKAKDLNASSAREARETIEAREAIQKKSKNKHNSASENPKKNKVKKLSIIFKLILLLLIGIILYFAYLFLNAKETGFYTVAIFGVDSRDGNLGKGALADVNMIASINRETGEIKLVSLYRDTYSEIDGKGTYHKLNEAYFKGGPTQALNALKRNFDLKVDDYATVNWKAVVDGINILGGIDLEITKSEFKYINSFITETVKSTGVGSHQLKSAGMQHLDGVQAVAYARLRLMDTDFNRTERQRKVVSLAFEKLKKADIGTINNILVTVFPQVSTSVSLSDIIPMARNANKYHLGETTGFPFEKDTKIIKKRDYVIPISLKNNVTALHKFLYGDKVFYAPSNEVKQISASIIKNTGIGDDKELTDIEIKKDEKLNPGSKIGNETNTSKTKDSIKENSIKTNTKEDTTKDISKSAKDLSENTEETSDKETVNNGTLKESVAESKETVPKSADKNTFETEKIINEEENDEWMSRHNSNAETKQKARIIEDKNNISDTTSAQTEIGPGVGR